MRGVGNPILVNNLFRTPPRLPAGQIQPFAMLGIDLNDAPVRPNGGGTQPSNAFSSSLVGQSNNQFSNGFFTSMQVSSQFVVSGTLPPSDLFDCHPSANTTCTVAPTAACCTPAVLPQTPCVAAPPPQPIVEVWDGATIGVDPVFVGEFLAPSLGAPPSRYRDWRLLPGSPMIDAGINPFVGLFPSQLPTLAHADLAWSHQEPACKELHVFDWDHEGFGNPRVSGASADIGFDEFQMFIMAGSYANDSNSHNVSGFLNPTPEAGRPGRVMIFPNVQGTANLITVNGVFAAVAAPPPAPPAWTNPPRVTQVINSNLPVGFQTRYISFANNPATGTPTPWATIAAIPATPYSVPWNPTQPQVFFRQFVVSDAEPSHGYFGTQAVLHAGDLFNPPATWSNLQYEYR